MFPDNYRAPGRDVYFGQIDKCQRPIEKYGETSQEENCFERRYFNYCCDWRVVLERGGDHSDTTEN